MRTLLYFWASFCVALYLILVIGGIIMEKNEHPEWYGTYYSLNDALSDNFYGEK